MSNVAPSSIAHFTGVLGYVGTRNSVDYRERSDGTTLYYIIYDRVRSSILRRREKRR